MVITVTEKPDIQNAFKDTVNPKKKLLNLERKKIVAETTEIGRRSCWPVQKYGVMSIFNYAFSSKDTT
jgi:hypothetical protein